MASTKYSIVSGTAREWQEGFHKFKAIVYEAGIHSDLATLGLTEGAAFPEDSDYEIIDVQLGAGKASAHVAVSIVAMVEVTV